MKPRMRKPKMKVVQYAIPVKGPIPFPFHMSVPLQFGPKDNDENAPIDTSQLGLELIGACRAGNLNRVKKIIKAGGDPRHSVVTSESSRTLVSSHPIFEAIRSGNSVLVRYLIETENVDIFKSTVRDANEGRRSSRSHTYDALCFAIKEFSDVVMLEYLLHIAKRHDMIDKPVADFLFSCDPFDNDGQFVLQQLLQMTYLHYAAWVKNPVACVLLVKYGSDVNRNCSTTKGSNGHTPLELYPEMLAVLGKEKQKHGMGSQMLSCQMYSDVNVLTS